MHTIKVHNRTTLPSCVAFTDKGRVFGEDAVPARCRHQSVCSSAVQPHVYHVYHASAYVCRG